MVLLLSLFIAGAPPSVIAARVATNKTWKREGKKRNNSQARKLERKKLSEIQEEELPKKYCTPPPFAFAFKKDVS